MREVEDIRLTDEHTRAVVAQEQRRRGDSTITKTARAMILERAAQLEMARASDSRSPRRRAKGTPATV